MEHSFTDNIKTILTNRFGENGAVIFEQNQLIQYLNFKTRSANKGSKSRGSFANLYALYVIVEDYLAKNYDKQGNYSQFEGTPYTQLLKRQRELPFGNKLQNHALNNRVNAEYQKFFPTSDIVPILRNLETNRYWVNENLLKVSIYKQTFNIASAIMDIVEEYIKNKQDAFQRFIQVCEDLQRVQDAEPETVSQFVRSLLAPNIDARLFEIVSYSILKFHYKDQHIYWGFELNELKKEHLKLYKTGRTNANDGGIDFVMKPLGRFFQVTETLDFKKYFLDIDKIQKYPLTFVIKSEGETADLTAKIKENALKAYAIEAIVDNYMNCIEEIINIPTLVQRFENMTNQGHLSRILEEIILQSKIEFNYADADVSDEEIA
jgi:hypothetical protein